MPTTKVMWFRKVKEPLSDTELPQLETTPSRREEDQIQFARYDSRSSNRKDSDQEDHKGQDCIVYLVILAITLAVGLGLHFGLKKRHEHSMSVSSCCIPIPDEPLLNTVIEKPTKAHWKSTGLPPLLVIMGLLYFMSLLLVLVATLRATLMFRSVVKSLLIHHLDLI